MRRIVQKRPFAGEEVADTEDDAVGIDLNDLAEAGFLIDLTLGREQGQTRQIRLREAAPGVEGGRSGRHMQMPAEEEHVVLAVVISQDPAKIVLRIRIDLIDHSRVIMRQNEGRQTALRGFVQHLLKPLELLVGHMHRIDVLLLAGKHDEIEAVDDLAEIRRRLLSAEERFGVIVPALLDLFEIALAVAEIVVARDGDHSLILEKTGERAVEHQILDVLPVHGAVAEEQERVAAALLLHRVSHAVREHLIAGIIVALDVYVGEDREVHYARFGIRHVILLVGRDAPGEEKQAGDRNDHGDHAQEEEFHKYSSFIE